MKKFYIYEDPTTGFHTSYRTETKEEADKRWAWMLRILHGNRDVTVNAEANPGDPHG